MRPTYSKRILNYLLNSEAKDSDKAIFSKTVANRMFRNVNDIHGIIMRTARRMKRSGLLKSNLGTGMYRLTVRGRRAAS